MQSLWNQIYKYNSSTGTISSSGKWYRYIVSLNNSKKSKIRCNDYYRYCYYTSTTTSTTITNSSFVMSTSTVKRNYNNILFRNYRFIMSTKNTNKLLVGNPISSAGGTPGIRLHPGTVGNTNHQLFNETKKKNVLLLLMFHTRSYTTDTIIDIYRRLCTQQPYHHQQQHTNNGKQTFMVLIYTAFTSICSLMLWSVTSDMTLLGNNNSNSNCVTKAFSIPDDIEDDEENRNNNTKENKKSIVESVIDPLEHAIGQPIKDMIDTVSTSIVSSLINPNSSDNDSNNNNDMTDLIGIISTMIQSHTENIDSQMKQLMDQILRPNNTRDDDTTKDSYKNEKQIVQSLFNIITGSIAMTSTKSDTSETIDKSNNTDTNESKTKLVVPCSNITNSVSDLIEAILQKNRTNNNDYNNSNTNDTLILEPKAIEDTTSLYDLYNFLMTYHDDIQTLVTKYMSKIDYQRITPTAILYYTDYANQQYESILQEQIKNRKYISNPFMILLRNWQQEQQDKIIDFLNRNTTTSTTTTESTVINEIDQSIIDCIERHHDSIELVKLSYANTIDEVRIGLQNLSNHEYKYELIHCNLKSEPGKPAHFFAIRHDTNNTNIKESINDMNVILVIRGTKTIADAITDLLCDSQPYKESTFFPTGMAHSYILDSGRHIANQYQPILLNMLNNNNNDNSNSSDSRKSIKNINITIYGHSLGAGAGAIAAMELYNLHHPKINVQMIGYGCPAILSKDLAEQCSSYITTFINHSDLVPRLSGISLTNLLYDIIEFDWLPLAQRDVQKVLKGLQARQPIVFNNDAITTITNIVDPILESISSDTHVKSGSIKRIHTELYPPGKCIQIYRTTTCRIDAKQVQQKDESEHYQNEMISACYVPNWFYSKIDVNQHMIDDHLLSGGYIDAIADIRQQVNQKSTN